jgi:hypothetical protein
MLCSFLVGNLQVFVIKSLRYSFFQLLPLPSLKFPTFEPVKVRPKFYGKLWKSQMALTLQSLNRPQRPRKGLRMHVCLCMVAYKEQSQCQLQVTIVTNSSASLIPLPPSVNFTNILWAAFVPKSFCQKITNPNFKHIKAAQRALV